MSAADPMIHTLKSRDVVLPVNDDITPACQIIPSLDRSYKSEYMILVDEPSNVISKTTSTHFLTKRASRRNIITCDVFVTHT